MKKKDDMKSEANNSESRLDDDPSIKGGRFAWKKHKWLVTVSMIIKKVFAVLNKPMEWAGYFLDFFLNLFYINGNLLGLLSNFLKGKVVIPDRNSTTFINYIGYLDGRRNLSKAKNFEGTPYNWPLMDLCVMASKLAYESRNVVEEVVINIWKMHFVGFYNCWNDYQNEMSTFILCDKPTDADLILISFRGTKLFDAYHWSTNFDYSWYEIPRLGRLPCWFLQALGLRSQSNNASFQHHLQEQDIRNASADTSTVCRFPSPEMAEVSAYDTVRKQLKELLELHREAKFVVTGHSLGGALAVLFPTVLLLHEEREMMKRLMAVYTFGQPRVADERMGKFMDGQLNKGQQRYFRVVYCNDVVPRLPYDDSTFLYKHFGVCLYYNAFYSEQKVEEEPYGNYFTLRGIIPAHFNVVWELIRSFTLHHMYGPDYKENWCSILVRIAGLALPGLSAHSPREYVNCVRLGREHLVQKFSLE